MARRSFQTLSSLRAQRCCRELEDLFCARGDLLSEYEGKSRFPLSAVEVIEDLRLHCGAERDDSVLWSICPSNPITYESPSV